MGNTQFLFINRLDATLKTSAGISNDGVMNVSKYDIFTLGKSAKVYLTDETIDNVKVEKPNKALEIQGQLNHFDSPYFKMVDVYNMKSNDNRTILSKFKTYQQTSEYSAHCACIIMTLV